MLFNGLSWDLLGLLRGLRLPARDRVLGERSLLRKWFLNLVLMSRLFLGNGWCVNRHSLRVDLKLRISSLPVAAVCPDRLRDDVTPSTRRIALWWACLQHARHPERGLLSPSLENLILVNTAPEQLLPADVEWGLECCLHWLRLDLPTGQDKSDLVAFVVVVLGCAVVGVCEHI